MHSHEKEEKKTIYFKTLVTIVATILCVLLTIVTTCFYKTESIYALLFCPIVIAGVWFRHKALYAALALGVTQIICDYAVNGTVLFGTYLSAGMFVCVALLLGSLVQVKENEQEGIKDKYKSLFYNSIEFVFVTQDSKVVIHNNLGTKITGYSQEELSNINPFDLVYPDDKNKVLNHFKFNLSENSPENESVFRLIKKDGSTIWVILSSAQIEWEGKPATINVLLDATNRKNVEETLKHSERELSLLISQMQSGLVFCELTKNGQGIEDDSVILKTNKSIHEIMELDNNIDGKSFKEALPELKELFDKLKNVAKGGAKIQSEIYLTKFGKYLNYYAFSPSKNQFAVFFNDITDQKKCEREIQFLDFHDSLTGLYNGRYLESEIQKYNNVNSGKTSIIVAQLNGIKLANNAFRHLSWNDYLLKFANILKDECREIDTIIRADRDKFVVLLPLADKETTEKIIQSIRNRVDKETEKNAVFSAAIGYEIKNDIADDINEIYEQAENNMFKDKLLMSNNVRGRNIQTILNALYRISEVEQAHATNVSNISEQVAAAMGISSYETQQIKTAALLHDVGNISIDPSILTKSGKYTEEEWETLKKHPEAGYRILSASGMYTHIAKYVLEHHERWDGAGYPKGLKAEEISLPARIIAIVDSFDAMTTDKPYKKAHTFEEAIAEIEANAGKQYDPEVVRVFVDNVAPNFKTNT